ncbi:threonylcarbamoyl-AMP synthase [Candidatus Pacearchaeota archaeon CG_4_9_14_3_um_filter_31_7]|nr:MAG: threonylcarbamoyl-AMP synthase [Candidatus Pacearchaeota archaeon CG1_02_31_27]PIN92167.1 MAG: threonylcarbamoyl-AMP synthase [Candidatus Pacearchaeota archaeon CG10_big_fil_rev_8_21_14_0_10_31_59]PIZ79858.1 MAG: threonylcarbamoyl-AMP synthase [Candidatus Pacearchaeota archaeon CG_4_10_14_0_2_um_filter_31_10]PJA70877.1 MAG: threonylcarbamoyl-AMP synthase [Candidatus Pacearchaeota archaeon CG_4_9_14_3_um_filter_31_7]
MIIKLKEALENEKEIIKKIREGSIFIYPTDTIYGIGCDATNDASVSKIRKLKKRDDKPFSVIVPDKKWILKNCKVSKKFKSYIEKLPGPFTFIFELKKKAVSEQVNKHSSTIGVRIPDHEFIKTIQKSKKPFVTTSVNITGQEPITEISNLPPKFKKLIIIDDGKLNKKPSLLIDLTGNIAKIISR